MDSGAPQFIFLVMSEDNFWRLSGSISRWQRQSYCHPVSVSAVVSPEAGESWWVRRHCRWHHQGWPPGLPVCAMVPDMRHGKGVEHLVRSQFRVHNAQRASCKSTCVAILFFVFCFLLILLFIVFYCFFFFAFVFFRQAKNWSKALRLSCDWWGHSLP